MESSAKTGKFFIRCSQEWKRCTFWGPKHKSAIWDRTPPHLHIKPSLYVCRRVQGSQIFKQNWIISIGSRVIVILPIWVFSALGDGAGGWGILGWSTIVYMSSGMFRGKESLNRIELSSISSGLIEFCCFGLPAALGRGQVGGGCQGHLGAWGGIPPHMHTHAHARTCTYTHVYMYRNCKWPPTWRHPCLAWLACLTCMCVRTCMCMCVCMRHLPTHPYPPPPPCTNLSPPRGWTPRISKNSITLELIKIFQFRLKIWNLWRIPHPWVGV